MLILIKLPFLQCYQAELCLCNIAYLRASRLCGINGSHQFLNKLQPEAFQPYNEFFFCLF